MITRVPPGTWETLSLPSSKAAGDTAYQLRIDPRLSVRGRGCELGRIGRSSASESLRQLDGMARQRTSNVRRVHRPTGIGQGSGPSPLHPSRA